MKRLGMPDEHTLTLRQADEARSDFAAIEDELDFIKDQLARLPTRKERCGTHDRLGDDFLALSSRGLDAITCAHTAALQICHDGG
jgi:hypothetical protein